MRLNDRGKFLIDNTSTTKVRVLLQPTHTVEKDKTDINLVSSQENDKRIEELDLTIGSFNEKFKGKYSIAKDNRYSQTIWTVYSVDGKECGALSEQNGVLREIPYSKTTYKFIQSLMTTYFKDLFPDSDKTEMNNELIVKNDNDIMNVPDFAEFFQEALLRELTPIKSSPYEAGYDGPSINPSLKILGEHTNKLDQGRWEIFVVLLDEENKIGMRSGVKGSTLGGPDLNIINQYDAKLFTNAKQGETIKTIIENYRWGHPSLALDTRVFENDEYRLLPIFCGGWMIRNDDAEQKKIQICWRSGRYSLPFNAPAQQTKLLELYTVYKLTDEYGKDFTIEFFSNNETEIGDFINLRAPSGLMINGKAACGHKYTYHQLCEEVTSLVENEKNKTHQLKPRS